MSKLIYIHNDNDRILDILLTALRDNGYNPEHISSTKALLSDSISADIAFVCTPNEDPSSLKVGDLTLDLDNICIILKDGDRIHLTPIEFAMLSYLMKNSKRAVSRKELMPAVWGTEYDGNSRVADDTAKRLRKKLKGSTTTLETVWNYGFRLTSHL